MDVIQKFLELPPPSQRHSVPGFLNELPITSLLLLLQNSSPEQIDAVTKALGIVLETDRNLLRQVDPGFFRQGLQHSSAAVRKMTTYHLARFAEASEDGFEFLRASGALHDFVDRLDDKDSSIAEAVAEAIQKSGGTEQGLSALSEFGVAEEMSQLLQSAAVSESGRVRILDIFSRIAAQSSRGLAWAVDAGALQWISRDLRSRDLLVRINMIQLLTQMCSRADAVRLLRDGGLLGELWAALADDTTEPLVTNAILRFIAQVAAQGDAFALALVSDDMLQQLHVLLTGDDLVKQENAVCAVGGIASSRAGLSALYAYPRERTLQPLVELLTCNPEPVRLAALHAVAALLDTADSQEAEALLSGDSSGGAAWWVDRVVNYHAAHPSPPARLAAYHLLNSLVRHAPLVTHLFNSAGFFDWLTNRATDAEKAGKEWKWVVARRLVAQHWAHTVLGDRRYRALQEWVRHGPFYTPSDAAVAVADRTSS